MLFRSSPILGAAATLMLGGLVGKGSTRVDDWLAARAVSATGPDVRWLLVFTSSWFVLSVLTIGAGLALRRRRWLLTTAVVVAPFLATAVNVVLKRGFERRNGPYLEYPSGHTTLLVTAVGMVVVVSGFRAWAIVAATAVSLLGMLGLIVCGYHYPTDTVGSVLLATAVVCLAARICGSAPRRRPAGTPIALTVGLLVALTAPPAWGEPGLTPEQSAAGLVDVRDAVADAIVDLRYARPDNFVGVALYPPTARCLIHRDLAPGLRTAADVLREQGRILVFWDCYRPHSVQVRMYRALPDPTFVARPGDYSASHETGRSVDVTFAGADCASGRPPECLADMGTDFDDFSPRAAAFADRAVSPAAAANRAALREAMAAGGLTVYEAEWWHFNGPGAKIPQRPVVDVPVG